MNKHKIILFCFICIVHQIVNAVIVKREHIEKDSLRRRRGRNQITGLENKENNYGLSNFEILKNTNNGVSHIELGSKGFFDILANTRLMQRTGVGPAAQQPIYRYVTNIHDKNENIGSSLVFLIFALLIFFIVFFIFYFIFKSYVKHIKNIKS